MRFHGAFFNYTAKHNNVRKINGKDYDVTVTVYIPSLGVPHFVSDILHITMDKNNLAFFFHWSPSNVS